MARNIAQANPQDSEDADMLAHLDLLMNYEILLEEESWDAVENLNNAEQSHNPKGGDE